MTGQDLPDALTGKPGHADDFGLRDVLRVGGEDRRMQLLPGLAVGGEYGERLVAGQPSALDNLALLGEVVPGPVPSEIDLNRVLAAEEVSGVAVPGDLGDHGSRCLAVGDVDVGSCGQVGEGEDCLGHANKCASPPSPMSTSGHQGKPTTTADELLLDAPAARPCTHRRAHPHATLQRYKQDRCRCLPCRTANADYERLRRASKDGAYGRWSAFADAAPVRAHLLDLTAAGMSSQGIAARAHLDPHTVRRAMASDTRRIRRKTAAALLAIQAGHRRTPQPPEGLWDG